MNFDFRLRKLVSRSTRSQSWLCPFRNEELIYFLLFISLSLAAKQVRILIYRNRPFPSFLVSLFQSESKCENILMKMTLICMKMKLHAELIFIWKVSHLDSFWNRGTRELGNGLLAYCIKRFQCGVSIVIQCISLPFHKSKAFHLTCK